MSKILFVLLTIVFWISRIYYWKSTYELPFSDMSDFDAVARNILSNFDFGMGEFWLSYKSPTLPVLRAVEILLFGHGLFGWQVFQAIMCYLSLIFLAREMTFLSKSSTLGLVLIASVVFSKASIFWSHKLATEGTAEALMYLSLGLALYLARKPSVISFFIGGMVFTATMLNRPNYLLGIVLFPFVFLWIKRNEHLPGVDKPQSSYFIRLFAAYVLAICIVWLPWVARSYKLYGHIVPLNTSGNSTFIYGVWNVEVQEKDGSVVTLNWDQMMAQATHRFQNDYEFNQWCGQSVSRWWQKNWRTFPGLYLTRVWQAVTDRDVQLTKVSRLNLYPDPLNIFLFDKSYIAIFLGIAGLMLFPFLTRREYFLIPALCLPSWFFALTFQGNPRFLEPVIPLFLYGNVSWVMLGNCIARGVSLSTKKTSETFENVVKIGIALFCIVFLYFVLTTPNAKRELTPVGIDNNGFEQISADKTFFPNWELGGLGEGNIKIDSEDVHSGSYSAELLVTAGQKAFYQDLKDPRSIAGKEFVLSAWVKAQKPSITWIAISDGQKWFFSKTNSQSDTWEEISVRGVSADDPSAFRIHFYASEGVVKIDDVALALSGTE